MHKKRFSLAVALPMYNEEQCAERAIRSIFAVLDTFAVPTSILVIDDGSKDNTAAIVQRLQKEYDRLWLVTHPVNQGYGGAIKSAYAQGIQRGIDYVLFMDSDLTQHPKYLAQFLPKMEAGVDVIKASRYIAGGAVEGVPWSRVLFSKVGNWLAGILYGLPIKDYTNGFRALKLDLARRLNLEANGFDILMEELYQAKHFGATFAEVPYLLTARSKFDGKSTFSYRPRVLYRYLKHGIKCLFRIPPSEVRAHALPADELRKAA